MMVDFRKMGLVLEGGGMRGVFTSSIRTRNAENETVIFNITRIFSKK